MGQRRRVVILQRWLMHYRLPFFARLVELAREADYSVELLYGEPTGADRQKKDWFRESDIPGARRLDQWCIRLGQREAIWHSGVATAVADADLVVSQQENRILRNHLLALKPRSRRFKLAWWGHGEDFLANKERSSDAAFAAVRRMLLRRADWFFAYTALSANAVEDQGFPRERITTLNNTIDVNALVRDYASVSDADVRAMRERLALPAEARVGVFIGGLYPAKRLETLVEAARIIRTRHPHFVLVVGGSGAQEPFIRETARTCEWLKFAGPVFDRDKAVLLAASSVWLNPGLVGLAVVDALAVGVPMVTTTYRHHSPEIVYLKHNENGVITDENAESFAAGALRLLEDETLRSKLAHAGKTDARKLTIDQMARNFLGGIQAATA